ncbi:unnamed protein product [Polarella glacialis]|uniref:Uncharacterized protein n=1 Tax=Polarella glacialis TaxID=89957 RepID=A0A813DL63_POLGL|nr:unnamed protein product [Polarella glacialis]
MAMSCADLCQALHPLSWLKHHCRSTLSQSMSAEPQTNLFISKPQRHPPAWESLIVVQPHVVREVEARSREIRMRPSDEVPSRLEEDAKNSLGVSWQKATNQNVQQHDVKGGTQKCQATTR